MKRQFFVLTLSALMGLGTGMAALAQDQNSTPPAEGRQGQHRQMDPNQQLKMLTKRLNLTEDQQKQILPILTDRQQQSENIRNDSSLAPKDRREKMRAVREDSEGKIKGVLTDSQKQTYEQMQQQMRERMQQHRDQEQNSNPAPSSTNPQ